MGWTLHKWDEMMKERDAGVQTTINFSDWEIVWIEGMSYFRCKQCNKHVNACWGKKICSCIGSR